VWIAPDWILHTSQTDAHCLQGQGANCMANWCIRYSQM